MSNEDEIFEIPQDTKPKKQRKKRELTEEQKDVLRERLKKAREARRLKSNNNSKKKDKSKLLKKNEEVTSDVDTIIESDTERTTTATVEPETEIDLNDVDPTDKEIMNLQLDIDEMNEKLNKKKKRSDNAKKGVIINQRRNIESIVEKKLNEKFAKLNTVVQEEVNRRKVPSKNENHKVEAAKVAPKVAPKVQPKIEPPKPKPKPVAIGLLNTPFWAL